jgi:multicomponent K+:H+ antiporter subunit A
MSLALIAALPFLGALLPGLMIRAGRNACAMATGSVTLLALVGLLVHAPAVVRGEVIQARFDWIPVLGLNANFFLDGLGLLFAGLILGIGLLIILYARFYLSKSDPMGQFYTYLLLFQGAMVGIVLSDNILLLLIFWELTSAFFIPADRLLETPARGAAGRAHGAGRHRHGRSGDDRGDADPGRDRRQLRPDGDPAEPRGDPGQPPLPARADPDPAGLLHEIGAVPVPFLVAARDGRADAGVGLSALGHHGEGGAVPDGADVAGAVGHDAWFYIVATTGLITMVLGAVIALFKDDLKALLAFSTVSHLGFITMLLGMGTPIAAVVAVFHIINHATFKARCS